MIKTVIKKGTYHDSVVLMLLTNQISAIKGVKKVSIMMATPANKDIFRQSGLETDELLHASANDMAVVMDIEKEELVPEVLTEIEHFFEQKKNKKPNTVLQNVNSWEKALAQLPDANLAVISVPGAYAALEADRALDEGMHVFMFSDNVSPEEELRLKQKAHAKGLLVMGPDCGTGIIQGVPIAFTNYVEKGQIAIIGASGTGIQELTTVIDRLGEGVTNAIGVGGRDLSRAVGGITMLDLIDAMEQGPNTKVLLIVSKPPAKEIRERISERLQRCGKPVVAVFLGEKPVCQDKNFYQAYTLNEAAHVAVSLLRKEAVQKSYESPEERKMLESLERFKPEEKKSIKAYYSGGTLANEAAMLIKDALDIDLPPEDVEGYMLQLGGNVVIDLGDDAYTKGKPHPMIDPAKRIECMEKAMDDPTTGVILFDVMLGYGSHPDMAGALLPTIRKLRDQAQKEGRRIYFAANVCGTRKDFQGYEEAVSKLRQAGVIVCENNKTACRAALQIIGHDFTEPAAGCVQQKQTQTESVHKQIPPAIQTLLSQKPKIINIGLQSFAEVAEDFGCQTVQYDWKPPASGNVQLIKALQFLRGQEQVTEGNQEVIAQIVAAQPVLVDTVSAKEVIPEMADGKVLLHAGPPITYEHMPDPMKGSCIGAILFEEWADTEAEARTMLEKGEIRFIPCHHVHAVGPMGGITSPTMPVLVVENQTDGNRAYCTMNEGIGKVLRFGAYSQEVIERLRWMREVLGPVFGAVLRAKKTGIAINPLIAKAIAMGDEFHQRNIAASLVFMKEVVPMITAMDLREKDKYEVIKFLADTDQFFLNIMMATGKVIMDSARTVPDGTVVTAMCRNGYEFGIRIAGMGDQWFTGPVNTPQGLYFTGYDSDDACPDMGDSAITETVGVGGMAMIAAPAVTRFVGAGGYGDALRSSNEMEEICLDHNPNYVIPTWDFKGTCLGIDACLVVEKGITPVINTGIAHKIAGYGQIGAGTVHPPITCFEKAVLAYAEKLGFALQE